MNNQDFSALLKDALHEIRRLRLESEQADRRLREPIAILSMACRFPRAESPEELWRNTRDGVDCIQPIPLDRWERLAYYDPDPDRPGKMICTSGGFLDNVRRFDASFFGISPREAKSMDPQQRMLLELSWEALERAALVPGNLFASQVGVFLGISNIEYATIIRQSGDASAVNSYYGTGNAASVAAGRLAYYYGFQGPAFVVDTACSSSLVAIHQAVASLRRDECSLAIAGGVNVMLLPETFVHFSNGRMLSSDGRCKPFSNSADGYGRSEGCGLIVLKRLQDAVRDRDPIVAILRGSAINHDGRSAGLTAPNGPAQEAVIQAALEDAGLTASDIQFVEAHGTGTPLGDPIEAGAIARVYGNSRTADDPLMISSVKANIGHAESAAGVAGVIHAALCLQHAELPPLLHMSQRSPHIPWESIQFATMVTPLHSGTEPVRCGVSSFGFSGSNGHLILEQYRPDEIEKNSIPSEPKIEQPVARLLVLSAKTDSALQDLVVRVFAWLESDSRENWEDICYTLWVGRSHFSHRVAVVANNRFEAANLLREFSSGRSHSSFLSIARSTRGDEDLRSLGESYAMGKSIDETTAPNGLNARRICLPTYVFQGEEFWVKSESQKAMPSIERSIPRAAIVDSWKMPIEDHRLISEHQLFGAPVMPGVGWIYFATTAAQKHLKSAFEIRSLQFERLFLIPDHEPPAVHIRMDIVGEEHAKFRISASAEENTSSNDPYASGDIQLGNTSEWLGGQLSDHQKTHLQSCEAQKLYDQLESLGFGYGPSFQKLKRIWVQESSALGQLDGNLPLDDSNRLGAMLGLLDSTLHTIAGATLMNRCLPQDATAFIPIAIDKLHWRSFDVIPAWSLAVLRKSATEYGLEADVFVWSAAETPILQILGIRLEGFSIEHSPPNSPASSSHSDPSIDNDLTYAKLISISEPERTIKLQEYLRQHLARELEIATSNLTTEQPLAELGLDSLMIFRMGIQLESEFGFAMDTKAWMDGLNLRQLTRALIETVERKSQLEMEANNS